MGCSIAARSLAVCLISVLVACGGNESGQSGDDGDDGSGSDAGSRDAGGSDAGGSDAGGSDAPAATGNVAPSFTKGANQTVAEDAGAQSISWATAISAGPASESTQTLTFAVTNDNAALFAVAPAIAADGTLSFTSTPNAFGTATVTVVLHDDGGTADGGVDTSAAQTFTITVTPVNDPPSFTKGADITIAEDAGAQSSAWATNISSGPGETDTLTFAVTSTPNGFFSVAPAIDATGHLTFTTAPNVNGTASLSVTLSDGTATTTAQTFSIIVTPVDDPPSFTKGADVTVAEDSARYAMAWATNVSVGATNETQTPVFTVSNNKTSLFSEQPAIDGTGVLTFKSAANANGSATVTVKLSDGATTTTAQTFAINVTAVDDPPVAVDDSAQVGKNAAATTIDVLANDTDIDAGPKTIAAATTPGHGAVVVAANGLSLTYQPTAGYCNDTVKDTFDYTLAPGGDTGTVSVLVSCTWPGTLHPSVTGTQQIHDIAVDANGDIVAVGEGDVGFQGEATAGGTDALVMKVRHDGTVLWSKTLGDARFDAATSVALAADGTIVVGGYTNSVTFLGVTMNGLVDAFVVTLDPSDGTVKHQQLFGAEGDDEVLTHGLVALAGGDIVLAGYTSSSAIGGTAAHGGYDGYLLRVSSDLATVRWAVTIGGTNSDFVRGITTLSDGAIGVTGTTDSSLFATSAGSTDLFVGKLDASTGASTWMKQFGGSGFDQSQGIAPDLSGGMYVVGETSSATFGTTTGTDQDAFVVAYLGTGTQKWVRRVGGAGTDDFQGCAPDGSGGVIAVGYGNSNLFTGYVGSTDGLVVRYDASGTTTWGRELGTVNYDALDGAAVVGTSVYVGGESYSNGDPDWLLAKYALDGTLQ